MTKHVQKKKKRVAEWIPSHVPVPRCILKKMHLTLLSSHICTPVLLIPLLQFHANDLLSLPPQSRAEASPLSPSLPNALSKIYLISVLAMPRLLHYASIFRRESTSLLQGKQAQVLVLCTYRSNLPAGIIGCM